MSLQEALTETLDLNVTQQGILNDMFPKLIEQIAPEDKDFELGGLVYLKSNLDITLLFTVIEINDEDQELLVAMVSDGAYKETVLPYEAVVVL